MAKLDKTQREYIIRRISTEASRAILESEKKLPTGFTVEEVKDKLLAKGFLVPSDRFPSGVSLPPTAAMEANKKKREVFAKSVRGEQTAAVDEIMLSDVEGALAVLSEFTRRLSKL